MYITFSGPSASGKSSLISSVVNELIKSGKTVHLVHEDSFFTISILKKVLGNSFFSDFNNKSMLINRPKKNSFSKEVIGYVYPMVVLTEYLMSFLVSSLFRSNTIVIRDRSLIDYYVTFKVNHSFNNPIVNLIPRFCNISSYSIYIDISLSQCIYRNKNKRHGLITSTKSFHKKMLKKYASLLGNVDFICKNNSYAQKTNNTAEISRNILLLSNKRIALIGLDGSGKSTMATILASEIESKGGKSKVIHFYHNSVPYRLLKYLNLWRRDESINANYARNRLEKIPCRSFVWAMAHFSDSIIQYAFYEVRHRNKCIIYDRFFHDYLVSFEYYKVNGKGLFSHFVPKIDKLIHIDVDPIVAFNRKPENTKNFFRFNASVYRKIAKKHGACVVKPDDLAIDALYLSVESCITK